MLTMFSARYLTNESRLLRGPSSGVEVPILHPLPSLGWCRPPWRWLSKWPGQML